MALEAIHRQYRRGGLSETQMDDLLTRLDQSQKGLPGAVWGAYTVTVAPAGDAAKKLTLWVKEEHGFPGYHPGAHSIAQRAWKRLLDEQRLLERLDPRLIIQGKGEQWKLWLEEQDRLNVATLWDYFLRFSYLPMLTGPEALQQTITWGVQRGLFAYALGDGEAFDTIHFQETRPTTDFAIIEGAWLLRPALVEALIKPETRPTPLPPAPKPDPQPGVGTTGTTGEGTTDGGASKGGEGGAQPPQPVPLPITPPPPPATYRRITIDTQVNWKHWYDFYQAVLQPLAETGVTLNVRVQVEATGEVDANLVDLSVKESVIQLDPCGKVEMET